MTAWVLSSQISCRVLPFAPCGHPYPRRMLGQGSLRVPTPVSPRVIRFAGLESAVGEAKRKREREIVLAPSQAKPHPTGPHGHTAAASQSLSLSLSHRVTGHGANRASQCSSISGLAGGKVCSPMIIHHKQLLHHHHHHKHPSIYPNPSWPVPVPFVPPWPPSFTSSRRS